MSTSVGVHPDVPRDPGLRRLTLVQASCRAGALGLGVVRDSGDEIVAVVEAIIVSPARRAIHSFLVRSTVAERFYLLPLADVCAHIDPASHCLEVEIRNTPLADAVDPDDYAVFSDDDWFDCLFRWWRSY